MFFEYFENLRHKSVEARKRFAFMFTVLFTSVIVFIYLLSIFFTKIATRDLNNEGDKEDKDTVLQEFNETNPFLDNPDVNSLKKDEWRENFNEASSSDDSVFLENASTTIERSMSTSSKKTFSKDLPIPF
jgi:hypothetical protein